VDVQVPGEGAAVVANVGIGGLLGWSWMVPSRTWALGAVCVTEVRACEFNAAAVRACCAADPALGAEFTVRLFQVVAARLQDTRSTLISRSADASRPVTS
jgi:CRP/FNR family transcriptional regulator, cyclic AMP receptor protein